MTIQARSCDSIFPLTKLIRGKRWSDVHDMLEKDVSSWNHQDACTLKYPLHLVSSAFDAPPDQLLKIMPLLIQDKLDVTEVRDKNGYTPLHLACAFGLDASCIRLLVEANESVCEFRTKNGDTPLSLACQRSRTSHETVTLLLRSSSISMTFKNNMGWSPLHCGVWHNISTYSLNTIIEKFSDAIFWRTFSSEHTPLSLFWSNHRASILSQEEWETVSLLVGAEISDLKRSIPPKGLLHKVISFPQYLPGLIESIVVAFPNEVKIFDEFGRLPLHRMIESGKNFAINDIHHVLASYPEAAGIVDPHTGNYALHTVIANSIERNFSWHMPRDIFHHFPGAIYIRSHPQKLFPFMLAASTSSLDICFELLRSAPELVYS